VFSPLNVIIRPSRLKRWLYCLIHALAAISVYAASLPFVWQGMILLILFISFCYLLLHTEPITILHWDLINNQLRVANSAGPLQLAAISELYLIFGILYLHLVYVEENRGEVVKLLIFPDSVDVNSYRRLRVAARWARVKVVDE